MVHHMKNEEFPRVQGGGSLMIAWQIRDKRALVIGGGEIAAGRILNLLNADALVTCVSLYADLNAEIRHRVKTGQITHVDRPFLASDLDDPDISLVLVALEDAAASTEIWQLCKHKRIPANVADVPPECDFHFGAVHRDGPLQIMVATNGRGPRLAAKIRDFVADMLPRRAGSAVANVGELRKKLRLVAPAIQDGPRRMRWMSAVCDKYSFDELCTLDDEDLENLLVFYSAGSKVPDMRDLKARRKDHVPDVLTEALDGSFGFSVGS